MQIVKFPLKVTAKYYYKDGVQICASDCKYLLKGELDECALFGILRGYHWWSPRHWKCKKEEDKMRGLK